MNANATSPLIYLPCLDSPARAALCRDSLAIPRERAKAPGLAAVAAAEGTVTLLLVECDGQQALTRGGHAAGH